MNLPYPHFQVSFKVYPGTSGEGTLAFTRLLEATEVETNTCFVLTSQLPDIRLITEHTDLVVTAPAIDAVEPGRGMGKVLPETVADAGTDGVVINHAENRDTLSGLVWKTERCHGPDLDSVVCVDSIEMGRTVAEFDPDSIIYKMPEDILPDRAITQMHPGHARNFMSMVEEENPCARVLVSGDTSTVEDVRLAFEQGGHAVDAASAVSLASELGPFLRDVVTSFP